MNRKLWIAIGGVLVAVLLVVLLIVIGGGRDGGDQAGGQGGDSGQAGRSWWEETFSIGGDGDDQPLKPSETLFHSAAEYRTRAKYPPDSYPIVKTNDPVSEDHIVREMQATHPEHPEGPFLVHYVEKVSFEPDEPLILHAYMLNSDREKFAPRALNAQVVQGGERGRVLANLPLRDDGGEGDRAGDLVFTAAYRLPAEFQRDTAPPANFTVVLVADVDRVGEMRATNAFNVGRLSIRHTGRFFDRQDQDERGQHLVIDVEVDVNRAGTYHLQGSLYSEDGDAIGWSQNRVELQPGLQRIALRYYGKMFCDAGADGPYRLQHINYMNVRTMPGPRSGKKDVGFLTQPYPARSFTCQDFNDPNLLEKARILEQEAALEP